MLSRPVAGSADGGAQSLQTLAAKSPSRLASISEKKHYWCARVGPGHRALGREHEGTLYWFWIGPHDEYERLLGKR